MKNIFVVLSLVLCCLSSGQTLAGFCGGGKVIEVLEGGWNSNDLLVKIDYSDTEVVSQHSNFKGYVRYMDDPEQLPTKRLEAIRKIALTALVSGKSVVAYSHNNACDSATQLSLFAFK